MNAVEKYTERETQFYPTPQPLIEEMLSGLDLRMIETILEPSAGKGDIIRGIIKKWSDSNKPYAHYSKIDIDCIEIDPNLQAILREKHCTGLRTGDNESTCKLVWDNFLTYEPFKQYDLIVMNPPFKDGDKHLLKALELQKNGGAIVCILNAETLKNPYTHTRQELVKQLEKYQADIKYLVGAFEAADRKTSVEIALIKVYIPQKELESDIYNKFEKAEKYREREQSADTDIIIADYIQQAIQMYNIEVKSSIELIETYKALKPHISRKLNPQDNFDKTPLLILSIDKNGEVDINKYLESVRLKYWQALFSNPKFTAKLTSNLQKEYRERVENLKYYEFNEFNIQSLIIEMNANIQKGVKETIITMFETLTREHSWYPECKNNTHYYNGWRTNIAHKINYKVIVPCYGVFEEKRKYGNTVYGGNLRVYEAVSVLQDIEKVLNYFDGNMTAPVDLHSVIEQAQDNPKNIECKFFKVTFYKKGTCHITFTNQALIDKFNIYVGQNKNWLPPHYGTVNYDDMTDEEQAVIDDFQGKDNYNKVMANKQYYLGTADLLRIEG